MWKGYPDLEIRLDRRDEAAYSVEYRLSLPDSDADVGSSIKSPLEVTFDVEALREHMLDGKEYGKVISQTFFGPELREALAKGVAAADLKNVPLRVRLFIGPTARELHSFHWETLLNPQDDSYLSMNEKILFSRYLNSWDMRPVGLPPKPKLRALVVIANPEDLARYNLAPIDVVGEAERAKTALDMIETTELTSKGKATVEAIFDHLRNGYDILYLVCHGTLRKVEANDGTTEVEPWLWLENKNNEVSRISGQKLSEGINQLTQCPRLVVLASCESAGSGEAGQRGNEGALAALGPQLAAAGVPAVVAMQANVSTDTIASFMPVLFKELNKHGEIDRSIAIARKSVRDRSDWWTPVLYTRLKSGRLWYAPGFGGDGPSFNKWPAVIQNIHQKQCTPILGLGLPELILGSRQEIARQWAERYGFPMSPHERDDFPRVAQYLAVDQQLVFPRDKLIDALGNAMRSRMTKDQQESLKNASLVKIVETVGSAVRSSLPVDPYKVLANLGLPIYVTTDPTDLLVDALRESGRKPVVEYFRWNKYLEKLKSEIKDKLKDKPDYEPSENEPLVFQLFGTIRVPESLLITEDNYFDYLIGFVRNKELFPKAISDALVDSGLLFLGFQLEDWNFRVLLRCILSLEGGDRRKLYAHISAQIDPNRILDPDGAHRYLEEYFQKSIQVNIYWGSIENFFSEFQKQWKGGVA